MRDSYIDTKRMDTSQSSSISSHHYAALLHTVSELRSDLERTTAKIKSLEEEVAALKAMTAIYVMNRAGADVEYARQREMISELVAALVLRGGRDLEPWIAPEFDAAAEDGGRLRVVIDQVASLTDASAVAWHARLCR